MAVIRFKRFTFTPAYLHALTIGLLCALLVTPAYAGALWPDPPRIEAKSWALVDAHSQQVLFAENGDEELPPASLTKLMTLYMGFQALKDKKVRPDDHAPVSHKAWKIGGSTMFLEPRLSPTIDQLLHGIATYSGNDACIVLAEYLAGSEEAFADRMNEQAKKLGMTHSHFMNATGWPAEGHYSSAHDMAILGAALWRDFPDYYKLFAERDYTYQGRTQPNRNRLLWIMPEADGLKTGHTEAAGYCLVGSARNDKTRLVSAVFGTDSDAARATQSKVLLGYGLRQFSTVRPATRHLRREIEIYHGKDNHLYLEPKYPVWVSIPKGMDNKLSFRLEYDSPMSAPIAKGQTVGVIEAVLQTGDEQKTVASIPMVAVRDVAEASWFGRQWDELRLWWQRKSKE